MADDMPIQLKDIKNNSQNFGYFIIKLLIVKGERAGLI